MTNRQPWMDWISATLYEAAWGPLTVFGIYLLGLAFHIFRVFPFLDMPVHFLGGVGITYFYRSAIKHSQKTLGKIPFPVQVLFALTCTGTTAILWEFCENIIDFFLGTHMVRGLQDTLVDLLMGLSGALVLSLFYRRRQLKPMIYE
jgi:hypothetical protein